MRVNSTRYLKQLGSLSVMLSGKQLAIEHGSKESFHFCPMPCSDPAVFFALTPFLWASEGDPM